MTQSRLLRILAFVMVLTLSLSVLSTAFAYNTIPYGEQSDNVRKMQKQLKSDGYYKGSVDGKFGPATKQAVRKFQSSVGLDSDGRPGHRTLTALYDGISALNKTSNTQRKQTTVITNPRSLYYGCTGSRVRSLQSALKKAGYFKSGIDGVYGDLTYAAVRRFQKSSGLHVDGIAGTKTIARLNQSIGSKVVSGSMLLAKGSAGQEVKLLQQFLGASGFHVSDTLGSFGDDTDVQLRNWQANKGLSQTGTFSEKDYNYYIVD